MIPCTGTYHEHSLSDKPLADMIATGADKNTTFTPEWMTETDMKPRITKSAFRPFWMKWSYQAQAAQKCRGNKGIKSGGPENAKAKT
jgi:hypothetical protein